MASKRFPCSRVAGAEGQLSIADLVRGLGDQRARLGPARKTLERLARKAEPVAPPLPGPVQRRQERRAGYEHAKEDVAKWQSIVKVGERIVVHLGSGMAKSIGIHFMWQSFVNETLGSARVSCSVMEAVLCRPEAWLMCVLLGR